MIVFFLVYSGLMTFFLMSFERNTSVLKQQTFVQIVRQTFFHKKAILALLLLGFALFSIWSTYEGVEWHVNEHSGYQPISTDVQAVYAMMGVVVYTISLALLLACWRAFTMAKRARN